MRDPYGRKPDWSMIVCFAIGTLLGIWIMIKWVL